MSYYNLDEREEIKVGIDGTDYKLIKFDELPVREAMAFDAVEIPDEGDGRIDALFAKVKYLLPGMTRDAFNDVPFAVINRVLEIAQGNGQSPPVESE